MDYLGTLKLKEGSTTDWDQNPSILALQMARKEGFNSQIIIKKLFHPKKKFCHYFFFLPLCCCKLNDSLCSRNTKGEVLFTITKIVQMTYGCQISNSVVKHS